MLGIVVVVMMVVTGEFFPSIVMSHTPRVEGHNNVTISVRRVPFVSGFPVSRDVETESPV